jgi:hypothetical protein
MPYAATQRTSPSLAISPWRAFFAALACSALICASASCAHALGENAPKIKHSQQLNAPAAGSHNQIFLGANGAPLNSLRNENLESWRRALRRVHFENDVSSDFQQTPSDATQRKTKRAQYKQAPPGSPGHIFWVVPAYKVEYGENFKPLTPREKFQEWAQAEYDPLGLGVGVFEAATIEHSSTDGFCGYGHGWGPFGECFGSLELDATDSSFIGDFLLPVWWHQDPRYFRLGQHSFGVRLWYAISRVFVTYNDSGHTVFDSSALTGTAVAAGLSNFYYPPQDVGVSHTMTRIAIDLGNTALYNFAAEFWPDIHTGVDNVAHKIAHAF